MTVHIDPARFRQVLGQYPTGVSVVTSMDGDRPIGMTVGTFTSVSLDPPLVAFLPQKTSTTWPLVQRSGRFCVNVLTWEQEHLCRQMARPSDQKFNDVAWRRSGLGSPIIDDAVAWIDCEIQDVVDAGDHLIVIGAVRALDLEQDALPLVFFRGGYGRFTPGPLFAQEFDDPTKASLLETARVEMLQLERELGADVAITGRDENEIMLMASTWTPLSSRVRQRVGDTSPAGPPYAIAFAAEGTEAEREDWVAAGVALSDGNGDRAAMLKTLDAIAERGWSAAVQRRPVDTWADRFVSVNDRLAVGDEVDEEFNLTVPLHDADGAVSLALTIYGMHEGLSGAALMATVDRLKEAASRIERVVR